MSCYTRASSTHLILARSREYITQEDLTKAARKVGEAKKHESKFCVLFSIIRIKNDSFTFFIAKLEYSAA